MLPLPTGREASAGVAASFYERHRPERTLLCQLVEEHYPAFKARMAAQVSDQVGTTADYSKVRCRAGCKVTIICSKHGPWKQGPLGHLIGYECKKCAYDRLGKNSRLSTTEFLIKARKLHGRKFDYSKVEYTTTDNQIVVICRKHGEFLIIPNAHLVGNGCAVCGDRLPLNTEQFIRKARAVYHDIYDYRKTRYADQKHKVTVTCSIHGDFRVWPQNLTRAKNPVGCPGCASHGFDGIRPAVLYYLRIEYRGRGYYKIGITTRDLNERIRNLNNGGKVSAELVMKRRYIIGYSAMRRENSILNAYKRYKYRGKGFLRNGNTELFTRDILGLDSQ